MQISKNIEDVTGSLGRGERVDGYMRETKWVNGKGAVGDVINLIRSKILPKKYHFFRNCQTFTASILKQFSKVGKTFHKYRVNSQINEQPPFDLRRTIALNYLPLQS